MTFAQILSRDDDLIESLFVLEERKAWECVTLIDTLDVDIPILSHALTSSGRNCTLKVSTSRESTSVTHSQAFLSSKGNEDSINLSSLVRICAIFTTLSKVECLLVKITSIWNTLSKSGPETNLRNFVIFTV